MHQIQALSDRAIIISFGNKIDREINQQVTNLVTYLDQHPLPGMIEFVPAFSTLTIFYDPLSVSNNQDTNGSAFQIIKQALITVLDQLPQQKMPVSTTVEIPVCYGGAFGPDLDDVARYNHLTPEDVVKIHSASTYYVYMIGFAPGFPYLGGMSEKIAMPRKHTPGLAIPAGSVGIAEDQTGIYSVETPGGWQIIGQTPLALFRPRQHPPTLLHAGQSVVFKPITEREFQTLKAEQV